MSSQQNDTPIDNELFRFYSQYKLCKIENSKNLSESEKAAIISILKSFQFVDGNILHSILNEAFEHASENSCFPVGKRTDIVYDSPSNVDKKSANSMANVIDLTLDGEGSSSSTPKAPCSELAHRALSTRESSDGSSDFEPYDLIPDSSSFSSRRKYSSLKELKEKGNAEEVAMQGILPGEAFIRVRNVLRHVEESKRTLCDRIKAVNDSFDIQNPFLTDTSIYGPSQTEIFKINKHFVRKSRLNQSQEHLAVYKIGKLTQRDRRLFSLDIVYRNMKRYYQGVIKELQFYSRSQQQDFVYFGKYCERVLNLVEKTGLYTIFIPEILSPYRIKTASLEDFEKIKIYLNQRCSCFKNVAHFDENGKLKLKDSKDSAAGDVGQSSSSGQSLGHV